MSNIGTDCASKGQAAGTICTDSVDRDRNARGQGDTTLDKAKQAVQQASCSASEYATQAVRKSEAVVSSVGQRVSHLADSLKQALPETGSVAEVGAVVSEKIKSGGDYLQTHDFASMSKDVTDLIRRYPMPALWIGVGAGFMLGKAMQRK